MVGAATTPPYPRPASDQDRRGKNTSPFLTGRYRLWILPEIPPLNLVLGQCRTASLSRLNVREEFGRQAAFGSKQEIGPARGPPFLGLVEVAITCSDFALPPRNPRPRCARTAYRSTFGLAPSVLRHPPIGRMPSSNSRLGDWRRSTQNAKGRSRGPLHGLVEVGRIEPFHFSWLQAILASSIVSLPPFLPLPAFACRFVSVCHRP